VETSTAPPNNIILPKTNKKPFKEPKAERAK
jgi:hypothetical protein